jgi:hypothetical protein
MGASLVGRSHCETPVLIWTSGVGQSVQRWCRDGVAFAGEEALQSYAQ